MPLQTIIQFVYNIVSCSIAVTYKPSMEVDSPSALLNQQIPKSYINLDAAIKRKVVDLVKNNKPPFMAQKEFYYCFHTIFDNDEELEEAVRFLSLQGIIIINFMMTMDVLV